MTQPTACKYCGGSLREGAEHNHGRHWKALKCTRCFKHNAWLPNPRYDENPGDFDMPFGKHRGKLLRDIATLPDGLSYLDWMARRIKPGSVQRRIAAFLKTTNVDKNQH